MKHSITKRFTLWLCWEVRMPSLPRHRRVHTRVALLSSLVARGLEEGRGKGWDSAVSWPKNAGDQLCDPVTRRAHAGDERGSPGRELRMVTPGCALFPLAGAGDVRPGGRRFPYGCGGPCAG
ncbi:hypothetical protein GCM10009801_54780 [Streptomyces albiaxialis]|uniref:Uncharacterized protein n=1 Tax=Streptomyces albiaxialis TaxID=329523 RepID=A0ABN2WER9_9ACTN